MERSKSYILLQLYDRLRTGGVIRITECCGAFEISVATFRRYIAFLRGYFSEMCGKELVYEPNMTAYCLR